MIVFPVLIPGHNFLFPGTGRKITKWHGKGREGKFEACIPGNHGKREFPLAPDCKELILYPTPALPTLYWGIGTWLVCLIIAFYLSCSRVVFIAWVVLGCIESTGVIMSDWRDIVFWVAEHKSSLYVELFFLLFFSKLVPLSPHSATVRVTVSHA